MLRSTSFLFDGHSSEDFGLMIYFLDDEAQRELELGTNVEMIEDRLPKRYNPIHYGVDINQSMSFPLTFGSVDYLSDYDIDAILSWLTGHQQYKWLEYVDGDHYVRYKCHLNNMKTVYINGLGVAFTCDVECDGQFGYEYPVDTVLTAYSDDTHEFDLVNRSSYNGYLFPKLKLEMSDSCNGLSIINESDNNREFKINYFDRVSMESAENKQTVDTTIAEQAAASSNEDKSDFMSWQAHTLPYSGNYTEIISGGGMLVALPDGSDVALYSEDNGENWHESKLPQSGSWSGCYGENGFVAVCTTPNTAIATYSQTGKTWNVNPIELPVTQNWSKVFYVETEGFMPNQYIAIASGDSSIAAITTSGWAWQSVSFPVTQEWRTVVGGNGKIFAFGGNQNIAIESNDCIAWREIELPVNGAWSASCYGPNGFLVVCNSLSGASSQNPIALTSSNGETWGTVEMPIGAWNSITYGDGGYIAVGGRQYAAALDGATFKVSNLPANVERIISVNGQYVCSLGTNKYIVSDESSTVKGSFEVLVDANDKVTVSNVYVCAEIASTAGDTSYASVGEVLLATDVSESMTDTETGETSKTEESTGGNWIAVTSDLRYGLGIDGVMMSATYDPETKKATVHYIADANHAAVINAPLTVTIKYKTTLTTDLGYDGLIVDIDNENQIIKTNKEALNLYEYFNMKFLRLLKGINHLKFKSTGGSCKITITCEFLRKVGGR